MTPTMRAGVASENGLELREVARPLPAAEQVLVRVAAAGMNRADLNAAKGAGVASKGAQRYGPGVQASHGKYTARFGPFLQLISGLSLTPRFPRGDVRNHVN